MKIEIVFRFLRIPVRFTREIPEKINDMSEGEYLTLFRYIAGQMNERKLFTRFFRLPPFVAWFVFVRKYWRYKLLAFIEPLTDFTASADHFILQCLPGKLNCYSYRLKGISFMQFMFADTMYTQYLQSKQKEHLYAFIASLFLRDGESFDSVDIDNRIDYISRQNLPEYLHHAVLLNYMMQKKWLSSVYPYMFSSSEEGEASTHRQQQNWVQIFDAFVGENIPDTPYYKSMPCMDAFRIINNRIKNYDKYGK